MIKDTFISFNVRLTLGNGGSEAEEKLSLYTKAASQKTRLICCRSEAWEVLTRSKVSLRRISHAKGCRVANDERPLSSFRR